jgi:hypothetical protein
METNLSILKFGNPLLEPLFRSLDRARFRQSSTPNNLVRSLVTPRNRLIDSIFYNVDLKDQQQVIDHGGVPQGSIILVSPDHNDALRFFPDAVEFFGDSASKDVGAVSVAGVGSSAIGAVGLARDVANATELPVAAIVSGYGMDDLLYEALGGWFFLREVNELEFLTEQIAQASVPGLFAAIETYDSVGAGPDMATAKSLLRAARLPRLQWIVGHSKGNLLISGAISELLIEGAPVKLDTVNLVLFSALTALPPGIGRQYQFIGSLDLLGWTNSRLNIAHKLMIGAMHHLNTQLPFHMNAVEQLRAIR